MNTIMAVTPLLVAVLPLLLVLVRMLSTNTAKITQFPETLQTLHPVARTLATQLHLQLLQPSPHLVKALSSRLLLSLSKLLNSLRLPHRVRMITTMDVTLPWEEAHLLPLVPVLMHSMSEAEMMHQLLKLHKTLLWRTSLLRLPPPLARLVLLLPRHQPEMQLPHPLQATK